MQLICIILSLALLLFPQSQAESMAGISRPPLHDVDDYDKAGPYEIARHSDASTPLGQVDKMRGWLWNHWAERRLALLIVVRHSTEGERSTYYYYLEPDQENRWRIAIKVESLEYNHRYGDPDCKRYVERYFAAYSLVRTELEADENGVRKVVPDEAVRNPATYLLSLRDQTGKEISPF